MYIKPLFHLNESAHILGQPLLQMNENDYNKNNETALIEAKSDSEAINQFLLEYRDSPETLRSYIKEIERLLLWCLHIGQVSISNFRREHLLAYQDFLKTPPENWCGPAAPKRNKSGEYNPDWRPFVKGLSGNSIRKAIKILDSFFNYLVQTQYLLGNPLAVERRRKRQVDAKPKIIDRYLTLEEIQHTLDAINEHSSMNQHHAFQTQRAQYIILLLFYSGMRISEAANHTMGHFIQRESQWFLRVIGKGKKLREIPVPDALKEALSYFRLSMGLPTLPLFQEATPLIPMANLNNAISARRIDQILRWAFNLGAATFEPDEPQKASKLRLASAHWLRHSYVTYLLDSGAPLKVAQENAGHSDVSTTMLYRHVAQTDRFEATRALSLNKKKIESE